MARRPGLLVAAHLVAASWLALTGAALAQSREPVLRIEAETHTAQLRDGATDAAGRLMVTASDDKTARVWSLPDLRLLGVLRPPVGESDEGKLYATAVSPDGRQAVVGGWSVSESGKYSIYQFDLATRAITRRFSGLPSSVSSVAIATDGRVSAGLAGSNGIRVWRDGVVQFQDPNYVGTSYGQSFAPDGRFAAAGEDGKVRLYDRDGHPLNTVATQLGHRPFRLRFSPDGALLAVGFLDAVAIELLDGMTLAPRGRADATGMVGGDLRDVAWSADGKTLFAGGDVINASTRPVFAWADAGKGVRRVAAAGFRNSVGAILPLPSGQLALGSASGDLAISAPDGTGIIERRLVGGDLRTSREPTDPSWRLRVAANGKVVEWVTILAQQRLLRFDTSRLDLRAGEPAAPGLTAATAEVPGLRVADWNERAAPKLNGKPLTLDQYENAQSASAGRNRVLLGTDWHLRLFTSAASQVWKQSLPGVAWRVNQSSDGRLAVAALQDSTIRWYRADTGRELLALYVTEDAERWIAFTPSGYFAAAPGAEDLIGWHVNRGPDEAADFFSAGQFRDRFYRPDVVSRVLTTLDEAEALKQADAARGVATRPAEPITEDLPPVVRILRPADGTVINGGEINVEYTVRSPSGKQISAMTVLIDGRPPPFLAMPGVPAITGKDREANGRLSVPVPPGRTVEIALLASTTTREGEAARIRVTSTAPAVDLSLPRLNGMLVGVTNYPIPGMKLNFAAKDARDIKTEFEKQNRSGLYREVALPIVDEKNATRKGIMGALGALRDRNTVDDVALVFLSGHGAQVGSRTFFLPIDVDPADLDSTAISQADMLDILSSIKGRVLVFLDICHAGAFEVGGRSRTLPDMTSWLIEFRKKSGIVVFSSSTGSQQSEELPQGNGAFTAAVLEGLRGAASMGQNGMIYTDDLDAFVTLDVRKLTQRRQVAKMLRSEGMPDFPIFAVARQSPQPVQR